MIDAAGFVEAARTHGYMHYTGVPCSFLTPFYNYVSNDPGLQLLTAANEGDAIATAAGLAIGGKHAVVMLQNSGLGNAINPLTSLTYTFRIPLLIIITHRGAPGLNDEPQHELMGRITGKMLDAMEIPWEAFPTSADGISPCLSRAKAYMSSAQRPYALLMEKGSVRSEALVQGTPGSADRRQHIPLDLNTGQPELPGRYEALQYLCEKTDPENTLLVATTGFTGRELAVIADRANHLYMVGSMGCASSLGLGLALACPQFRVVVLDGDGAVLMRMGNFATLGCYGPDNLIHLLLDNQAHDSTGGQATVSAGVDFAAIANACGYRLSVSGDDFSLLQRCLDSSMQGPVFGHLRVRPGTLDPLPRPSLAPAAVLERLMEHIGTSF